MNPSKDEYEIQYYGFSLTQFKLEHRLHFGKKIRKLTQELAESCIKELLSQITDDEEKEIRNKVNRVADKIFESCSNSLDEFDQLIDKHFTIPDNVLLEEDKIHLRNHTENDETFYKEQIEELEKSIKQNNYFLSRLNSDIEKFEKIQELVQTESELIEKVEKSMKTAINLCEIESKLNAIEESSNKIN